ncbi:MAG: methionyl-tRNA formyltransferase [Chitinivibrionales bacterium]|nr:methionyl-tRNA formyltransferase [Chitinivibrionales bacterium]
MAMRIVFMGSAEFGIPSLKAIQHSEHKLSGIVSTPARPKGRGLKLIPSPVAGYARANELSPVMTPAKMKDASFREQLLDLAPDIFIVIAFRILPESIYTIPQRGTYNLHASLLPKYRGPAPIQWCLVNGENETGITVFKINAGIDTGNILLQKSLPVSNDETAPQLYDRLANLGAAGIAESLEILTKANPDFKKQDDSQATPAPKLTKEDGRMDWRMTADELYNRIRAFKPFPGTYAMLNGKRISIISARPAESGTASAPGAISRVARDRVVVSCGAGELHILEVKPEGKRNMMVRDFLNGAELREGMLLQ